ncbi:MAG: hypothetical protein Fur0018_25240 [Anaerolineales bacterium]
MSKKKTSGKNAARQQARARQRRQKRLWQLLGWAAGLLVLGLAAFAVWRGAQPTPGESVTVLPANHVEIGSDPGAYNSNPPTSGPHYPSEFDAGFYDENAPQAQETYPAGYLVHNLEHGYVIFWYNCDALSGGSCEDLKSQIRDVMGQAGLPKLIAFPWPSLDVPVAMTSWGKLLNMPQFDESAALAFIKANYNRAPEPAAP